MSMKNLLRRLKLDELSLVDRGANPGARVTLWKRDAEAATDESSEEATASPDTTAGSPGNPSTSNGEDTMSEELEKKVGELEAQIAELTEKAESLTVERDALKADVDKVLEATGATLEKGEDGEAEVKLQKAEEYVEINGEKVAKSQVPGPVLKAIEAQNAEIAKIREEREAESLAKRAREELPNLAGDDALKGKLLKFVDGLDEAEAKAMREALKAADTATSKMFAEVGHNPADDEASASYKLRKRVEEYQAEHDLPSREVAFSKFVKTAEGSELRKAADAEQQ